MPGRAWRPWLLMIMQEVAGSREECFAGRKKMFWKARELGIEESVSCH